MAHLIESPLKGENGDEKNNHLLGGRDHSPAEIYGAGPGSVDGGADTAGGGPVSQASAAPEKGGAAMRGDGGIYLRGNVLWIAYSFRGRDLQGECAHQ
jgi:hypothetical protein